MTFDKQVKEAKAKQLQNRIVRDTVFILLGIIFLVISFISSYKNSTKEESKSNNSVTEEKQK